MAVRSRTWIAAALAVVVAAATFAIVRQIVDDGPTCRTQAEPIDPLSSQHLLPNAPEPTYNTDPPTSGAHKPGVHPTGYLRAPIERAVQVSLLEQGQVLIQWRRMSPHVVHYFAVLAQSSDSVTVAPNTGLSDPIVLTAWLFTMRCSGLDKTAIRGFIAAHTGKAPTH